MKRYTVDANALVRYCLGVLPERTNELFATAARGELALETPVIAAVEAAFTLDRRDSIRDIPVPIDAAQALSVFEALPMTITEDTHTDARGLLEHLDLFPSQMHDAMIVSNHVNRGTDAIITSDGKMAERFPTVWD